MRRVAAALCCHQLVPKARSSRAFNQSGHPICALCFESGGGHWRECLCCAGVVTGWDTDRILSEVRDMHSCITWCNCTGESHGAVAWGNRMVQLRGAIAWGMAWCNCTVQHTVQYTGWDGYAPKVMTARLAAPAVRADGLVSRVCASWSKRLEAARAESVCTVRNRLKSCLGTVSWRCLGSATARHHRLLGARHHRLLGSTRLARGGTPHSFRGVHVPAEPQCEAETRAPASAKLR